MQLQSSHSLKYCVTDGLLNISIGPIAKLTINRFPWQDPPPDLWSVSQLFRHIWQILCYKISTHTAPTCKQNSLADEKKCQFKRQEVRRCHQRHSFVCFRLVQASHETTIHPITGRLQCCPTHTHEQLQQLQQQLRISCKCWDNIFACLPSDAISNIASSLFTGTPSAINSFYR